MKKLLFLVLTLPLLTSLSFADDDASAPKTLSSVGGRYVFGQASRNFSDKYMLDTQSGRLWKLDVVAPTGAPVLIGIPYSLPDKLSDIPSDTDIIWTKK